MSKSFACSALPIAPHRLRSSPLCNPSPSHGSVSSRAPSSTLSSVSRNFCRAKNCDNRSSIGALSAPPGFSSRLGLAKRFRSVQGIRSASEPELEARAETSSESNMGGGLLDLEKQFSFYGAYHSNRVNVFIHILFVWPIFYTSLILWAYTPAFAPLPLPGGTLPLQEYMVLNWSFVQAAFYALYYVALDKKAGSLGAAMCLGCWIAANAVAHALPWSLSWKIVLASQITCWFAQIYGHQKYEGRAPALLDNLPQAFLMAPFFVLLECLQSFGYEPYPGFHKKVQKNVGESIREFRASKGKKAA